MIIMSQDRKRLVNSRSITDFSVVTQGDKTFAVFADDIKVAEYSTGSQTVEEFARLAEYLTEGMGAFSFNADDPLFCEDGD